MSALGITGELRGLADVMVELTVPGSQRRMALPGISPLGLPLESPSPTKNKNKFKSPLGRRKGNNLTKIFQEATRERDGIRTDSEDEMEADMSSSKLLRNEDIDSTSGIQKSEDNLTRRRPLNANLSISELRRQSSGAALETRSAHMIRKQLRASSSEKYLANDADFKSPFLRRLKNWNKPNSMDKLQKNTISTENSLTYREEKQIRCSVSENLNTSVTVLVTEAGSPGTLSPGYIPKQRDLVPNGKHTFALQETNSGDTILNGYESDSQDVQNHNTSHA